MPLIRWMNPRAEGPCLPVLWYLISFYIEYSGLLDIGIVDACAMKVKPNLNVLQS